MARVTVEDCLPLVDNRFALVLLATKRARQLMAGARPLIEAKDKPPVLALREVATGKVRFDRPVRAAPPAPPPGRSQSSPALRRRASLSGRPGSGRPGHRAVCEGGELFPTCQAVDAACFSQQGIEATLHDVACFPGARARRSQRRGESIPILLRSGQP